MFIKSVIVLITLFSTIYSSPQTLDNRIIGGVEVSPKFKYPWLVSLQFNGRHGCGGVILNKNTVLTAAHCSQGTVSTFSVNIHRHNLTQTSSSENGETIGVSQVINHPNYNPTRHTNDVSIWKLATPTTLDIDGIDLDDGTYGEQTGLKVIAAGWGLTQTGGSVSPVLREVAIPIIDKNVCSKYWTSHFVNVDIKVQVCAGGEGGKDACNGDSGGPLFTTGANGRHVLIGSTTFGKPCAYEGVPTVWARTSAFRSFIAQYS
ncbi:trypsin-like serine protease [Neoconidiobolus thromboides FSU 785]|nr:trypsin-like serine protease [Neoconidiobolus thromboides FSU 785]